MVIGSSCAAVNSVCLHSWCTSAMPYPAAAAITQSCTSSVHAVSQCETITLTLLLAYGRCDRRLCIVYVYSIETTQALRCC
jgi:hypothetical protein